MSAVTAALRDAIARVAEALVRERRGVAMTGAGVSVESGIPDFRSPGGLWERFDPLEYATIDAFRRDPRRVWQLLVELYAVVAAARPNPAHLALARLERAAVLDGIVTQNIDGLHQAGGSQCVIELHGNGRRLLCLGCGAAEPAASAQLTPPPTCRRCGAVLKPDVVLFGEALPQRALTAAATLAERCAVLLVVGTSATVAPASLLPLAAKAHGALLVEINLEPTELSVDCDVTLVGSAGVVLPALATRVEELLAASSWS